MVIVGGRWIRWSKGCQTFTASWGGDAVVARAEQLQPVSAALLSDGHLKDRGLDAERFPSS